MRFAVLVKLTTPQQKHAKMNSKQFDPNMDHLSLKDFDNVYEPNDDTWLFADTLAKESIFLLNRFQNGHLKTAVEIGVCKICKISKSKLIRLISLAAVLSLPIYIIY